MNLQAPTICKVDIDFCISVSGSQTRQRLSPQGVELIQVDVIGAGKLRDGLACMKIVQGSKTNPTAKAVDHLVDGKESNSDEGQLELKEVEGIEPVGEV